ncbi:hypothetical protein KSP39_PZI001332 [Platanthera zijinensis]|uniref:Uncharacterized protein n=1 Tax=Platanthera zijinensis TaxID=2320716 RepID=A0AAP0C108_9ASPA
MLVWFPLTCLSTCLKQTPPSADIQVRGARPAREPEAQIQASSQIRSSVLDLPPARLRRLPACIAEPLAGYDEKEEVKEKDYSINNNNNKKNRSGEEDLICTITKDALIDVKVDADPNVQCFHDHAALGPTTAIK